MRFSNQLLTLLSLVVAAALEVGGDAAVRRGLTGPARGWVVLGAALLVAYGCAVNLNRSIAFGQLMGVYIAVFFVVSQLISVWFFGERPPALLLVGGALIVLGAVFIQLSLR